MSDPARLLLVTSNGAGMGHLSRQLSVALAAGDRAETTIMSLSVALPVVARHGIAAEYCPSVERDWMPPTSWHGYLRDRLVALARETRAEVIAFDGVAPYPGIGMARPQLRDAAFVWFRRGMWRAGVNTAQLKKASIFDVVIEPGELAAAADRGATARRKEVVRIPPMSMLEVVDRLPRHDAAEVLGLDPDRPTVLVTLGSGRLGDVSAPGAVVMEALLQHTDWQICVTKPAIAQKAVPLLDGAKVVELRGVYPLVRYLNAFDAAVSAAGYNAVHEFLPGGLPTLLVPNPATQTDDQVARATWLGEAGLALAADPTAPDELSAAVHRLVDAETLAQLSQATRSVPENERTGGAASAADRLVDLAGHFVPSPPSLLERARRIERSGRETVKRLLGPNGTARVRSLLGRAQRHEVNRRLEVRVVTRAHEVELDDESVPTALLFANEIPDRLIRNGGPVEHLVTGSSPEYAAARRRIVAEYYDVARPDGPDLPSQVS